LRLSTRLSGAQKASNVATVDGDIAMYLKPVSAISAVVLFVFLGVPFALAAEQPIAIFHAFDQSFNDINSFVCQLARQGYSHIQIPPAQKSNPKQPNEWYYRYQPVEYGKIEGRGSEDDLKNLINKAASCDPKIKVIADVVFNHMASLNDGFTLSSFPEFTPQDFHNNCKINYNDGIEQRKLIAG
jgi:alpha-amylase